MKPLLIILSGIPGSGKSTFAKEHNLDPYVLSFDTIRLLYNSPDITLEGRLSIIDSKNTYDLFDQILENRMKNGQLIVIDNTNTKSEYLKKYQRLAYFYRYRAVVVDFRDIPLAVCKERNRLRPQHKVVPDTVVERFYSQIQELQIPKTIEVCAYDDFDIQRYVEVPDYSKYTKIHHIGDIQGTFFQLRKYLNDNNPLQKVDELFIFTGDLLDRGSENDKVLATMLDLLPLDNVVLIEGNHDTHLWYWANSREDLIRSKEFLLYTKPQLEQAGINKKKTASLLRKMKMLQLYSYNGTQVLVCHGGISIYPDGILPYFISRNTYIKGCGVYDQVLENAKSFEKNTQHNQVMIHGHRNKQKFKTQMTPRIYNLEGQVEFQGTLRIVTLCSNGFEVVGLKNEKEKKNNLDFSHNTKTIALLRKNNYIDEKVFGLHSSFNFNRKAFYGKQWNRQTITARGLFVNNESDEIIIRSYNKFFNIDEIEKTKLDNLKESLEFPVDIWVKENGYLGLLGYDSMLDKLVFASKSTTEGDFAIWFESLFLNHLNTRNIPIHLVTEFVKNHTASLVFEVILPTKDPHIIEYKEDKLVMLDAVSRDFKFQRVGYELSRELSKKLAIPFKQQSIYN